MHKKASKPLVLDYTLAFGKIETIRTQIFDSGYQGEAFLLDALSDHHLLFSEITLS